MTQYRLQRSVLVAGVLLPLLAGGCGLWVRSAQRQYALNRQLIAALVKKDTSAAIALVNEGADPNTRFNPDPVITPAQLWNHLIQRAPLPVNDSDTALPFAIQIGESQDLIRTMLQHGAEANTQDAIGGTPLIWANLGNASPEIVRLLLVYGADANARNRLGDTPLKAAIEQGASSEVLRLLLQHGADANARDEADRTPLMDALKSDCAPDTIRLLLNYGAEVNARDEDGRTALYFVLVGYYNSIDGADQDILRQLLAQGADPKVSDRYGDTPLKEAKESGRFGADLLAQMQHGRK